MTPPDDDKTDETPEKPKRSRRRSTPAETSAEAVTSAEAGSADQEVEGAAELELPRPASDEAATPTDSGAAEEPEAEAASDDDEPEVEEADEPEADADDDAPEAEAKPRGRRSRRRSAASEEADDADAAPPAPKPAPARRRRGQRDPSLPPPVVRAHAKYVRTSPRKARLVCDHIRGKSVEEARAILALTPRAVARDWSKLLESAIANAEHNHELVGEDLYVKAVHADDGPTIKRFQPRAMGRATKIRKRTSHLTILLTPKD
jgi:ribosomal protein L22